MNISINQTTGGFQRGNTLTEQNGALDLQNGRVFVGRFAGATNTRADTKGILIGHEAAKLTTKVMDNIFIGNRAGYESQSDTDNVYIGHQVGSANKAGGRNVLIGSEVCRRAELTMNNVMIGYRSGWENQIGLANVFVGVESGMRNRVGANNVFVGAHAGWFNTTGKANVFVGQAAGYRNVSGSANTYVGVDAGRDDSTGTRNVCVGVDAGGNQTNGERNVFIGASCGYGVESRDSSTENVFVGADVLAAGASSSALWSILRSNVGVGCRAGSGHGGGARNVMVGWEPEPAPETEPPDQEAYQMFEVLGVTPTSTLLTDEVVQTAMNANAGVSTTTTGEYAEVKFRNRMFVMDLEFVIRVPGDGGRYPIHLFYESVYVNVRLVNEI